MLNCETYKSSRTGKGAIPFRTKVGLSEPVVLRGKATAKRKSYPGDNRLILPKRSHRRKCLAPRCRLIASWGWRRSQGFGCSPIKAVRELGSKRRETVWSLSVVGVGYLRRAASSTRGPKWTNQWCAGCTTKCIAR